MQKFKKATLGRQRADLLLITLVFIAAIVLTILFRINENSSYYQALK